MPSLRLRSASRAPEGTGLPLFTNKTRFFFFLLLLLLLTFFFGLKLPGGNGRVFATEMMDAARHETSIKAIGNGALAISKMTQGMLS